MPSPPSWLLTLVAIETAARPAPSLSSYFGRSPVIDGRLAPGEWEDATPFAGVREWSAQFSPVTDDADLALRGWVKHDARALYFAFDVTDDRLYGVDTERWLPPENAHAHELSPRGFPWFGDELELLLDARRSWRGDEGVEGSGASWQMVCNATKSRRGGVGKGGLLEGEPRTDARAFATYRRWIGAGAQRCVVRPRPGGGGYVVEWEIRFHPCVEIAPGRFYDPALGPRRVGLNIALGDLDDPEQGAGNFARFHHEQWWSGARDSHTRKSNFGTLVIEGRSRRAR